MIYFIKNLPVEGEIEITKDIDLKHHTPIFNMHGDLCFYDYHLMSGWVGVKQAKLFLCSRDIKEGDKLFKDGVEYLAHLRPDGVPFVGYYNKDWCYIDDDCYKVIGEVSPEAVWVTEGMEFDEYVHMYMDEDGLMVDNLEFFGESGYAGPVKEVCKLKCSQCNTFH